MAAINRIDRLRGTEFQRFCDVLLSASDPTYHAVDGSGGDGGNDGFSSNGEIIYQAYAPDNRALHKVKRKVDDSVAKAKVLRTADYPRLRKIVFLTPFDLTPEQHAHLRAAASSAGFEHASWGHARLLALLADHPKVKSEFPEFLLPDLLEEIRNLSIAALSRGAGQEESGEWSEREGRRASPTALPWIDVLQNVPGHEGTCAAYSYFKLYVVAPALALPSIEPEDEDQVLALVREGFREDQVARIETRDHQRVLVEHGLPELRFHRRWGRWTSGMLTMASTIEDVHRRGCYSLADMACDVTRALRLAAELADSGPAQVVFGYDPNKLEVRLDPADIRARDRLNVRLGGVHEVARPVLRETRESTWSGTFDLAQLASDAHAIAAALMVPAVRHFHLARIDTKAFAASLPQLIAANLDAQLL